MTTRRCDSETPPSSPPPLHPCTPAPPACLRAAAAAARKAGINLEDYNCPLKEWIQTQAVSEEIKRRFKRFLTTFNLASATSEASTQSRCVRARCCAPRPRGCRILLRPRRGCRYASKVRQMCATNSESLEVSYLHLSSDVPILAIWVADAPRETLTLLDDAAMEVVRIMFPDYHKIQTGIHVRINELPIQDSIRELRQVHMDCLVKVSGVVTRRSSVHPQLRVCKYNCTNCGYILGPFSVAGPEPKMAGTQCPSCQAKGPYTLNTEQTVYCNYQKVTLQESPGSVPAGRLPRHKEVVMTSDLIDMVRPGEEIEVPPRTHQPWQRRRVGCRGGAGACAVAKAARRAREGVGCGVWGARASGRGLRQRRVERMRRHAGDGHLQHQL